MEVQGRNAKVEYELHAQIRRCIAFAFLVSGACTTTLALAVSFHSSQLSMPDLPSESCTAENESPPTPSGTTKPDLSSEQRALCLIDMETLRKLPGKQSPLFVELRSKPDYEQRHIEGSIWVPEYSLANKAFLRGGRPIVLIGEAALDEDRLVHACLRIRQSGVKHVSVLRGGLRAWMNSGGELAGLNPAQIHMTEITPRRYYASRSADWVVVALDDPALAANELFEYAPVDSFPQDLAEEAFILLVTANGEGYRQPLSNLPQRLQRRTFVLSGGSDGLRRYTVSRKALLAKAARGPVRRTRCGTL